VKGNAQGKEGKSNITTLDQKARRRRDSKVPLRMGPIMPEKHKGMLIKG